MDEGAEPPQASADEATVASGVELVSLKDGHAFLVADQNGDVTGGAEGLYDRDTRVLSRWLFCVGERRPTRLSSRVSDDNAVFTFHGTNRALPPVNGRGTPRGAIHIERLGQHVFAIVLPGGAGDQLGIHDEQALKVKPQAATAMTRFIRS